MSPTLRSRSPGYPKREIDTTVSRPPRSRRQRRQRREDERALRRQVRLREELAAQLPGGSAEQPIDVASASIVEGKARATPCIQCEGDLELRGDRALSTARGVLREIVLACRRCHTARTLWFRVVPPAAN